MSKMPAQPKAIHGMDDMDEGHHHSGIMDDNSAPRHHGGSGKGGMTRRPMLKDSPTEGPCHGDDCY
jgi:hypothetical protein